MADALPTRPGNYHISEKADGKGASKRRGVIRIFTTTITALPNNCQFDHLPIHDDNPNYKIATSYLVSKNVHSSKVKALIDGGANGGIAGSVDS